MVSRLRRNVYAQLFSIGTNLLLGGGLVNAVLGDYQVRAWHTMWHIVGVFGFTALWVFNHVRFVMRAAQRVTPCEETIQSEDTAWP